MEFNEEQQQFVDKLVGEARIKAREKAEAEFTTKQTKEREATEQAALAAEAKWQELAQKHEARVHELEPFEAKAHEYDELMESMLKEKVKSLSEAGQKAVKALPDSMGAVHKLKWINANTALFEESRGDGIGTPRQPPTPSSDGKRKAPTSRFPLKL